MALVKEDCLNKSVTKVFLFNGLAVACSALCSSVTQQSDRQFTEVRIKLPLKEFPSN